MEPVAEGSATVPRVRPSRRFLLAVLSSWLVAAPLWAAIKRPMPGLRFQVLDAAHQPLTGGTVAVCPGADDCHDVPIDAQGRLTIPSELILHHRVLAFVVYDIQGATLYATSDWSASAAQRRLVATTPSKARCRLVGSDHHGLQVEIGSPGPTRELTPEPVPRRIPRDLATPAPWRLMVGSSWLVGGHFTGDDEALGGVESAAAGPFVGLLYDRGPWRLGVGYALNRYRITRRGDTDGGDLSFHRASVQIGVVDTGGPWSLGLSGALSYGGIFDGRTRLELAGRSYSLLGFGLRVDLARTIWEGGARQVGAFLLAEALHYPSDTTDHDHWYGTAPALGLGVLLR